MEVANNGTAVLVVDDNPLILNVLKGLLGSEHYQVYSAENGVEAQHLIEKKSVDLIICDVMMPEIDGYELHRWVRQRPECAHIPFLFLTALDDGAEINQGRETGVDDYLIKPFEPRDLLSVVKGKLARAKGLKNISDERYESYRKRVVHTLSHEFRTPLVAINTGTELLIEQSEKLDLGKAKQLLEAIRRGGMRLERLVSDFMVLQQIEAGLAGRLVAQRAKCVDVHELIQEFVEKYPEKSESAHPLTVLCSANNCRVRVYPIFFDDILSRLVSNGEKFSPAGAPVELCVQRRTGEVAIEVLDRGSGIDLAKVREALDVFGQINREKYEQQGGGLGLAIASRYAHLHGGRVELDARDGGGTVARLVLPIATE